MTELVAVSEPVEAAQPELARGPKLKDGSGGYGKTAKVGAIWSVVRQWTGQLIAIPATLLLARLVSPTDFGIAAAATFFIQLGKRMGNMGLNTALVRMKDVREEHRASVFVVNMAVGLIAWAVLMASAPAIAQMYDEPRVAGALRIGGMIFLVNFLGVVEYAVLQRDMRFKEMAYIEWTQAVIFFPVAVGLAWAGYGYWALIVGQLVSNAASTAAKIYFGRWRPSLKATRQGLADTVPFGMGVYAKRLLTYAAQNLDSMVVGAVFGVTALGFYDKAFNAVENLANRLSLGTTVMFRIFALIKDEHARFVRAYNKAVLAGTLVTLPLFAGVAVAAREFVVVLFGSNWLPAVVPLQVLCAAAALRLISDYASAAVQATGQIWSEVWRKVLQVVLIVAAILAFRRWGISGAAGGVLVAMVVLMVLMQALVRRIVTMTWRESVAPFWPGLTAAAITAAGVATSKWLAVTTWPDARDWVVFILESAGGGLAWATFVLFARFRGLQDIVEEVLQDVVPAVIRAPIQRIRRVAYPQEHRS